MMFIKKSPNSHGFVNPRDIEQIWRDQFDWVYREMDYAVFPITIHPDVSGRPSGADDAGASVCPHHQTSRREVRYDERDGRRFRAALSTRKVRSSSVMSGLETSIAARASPDDRVKPGHVNRMAMTDQNFIPRV
jgi:hypothetical protein